MASDSRPLIEAAVDYSETLKSNLTAIGLPDSAVSFLLGVWNLTQVFDDAADGGTIARHDLDRAIWFAFVGMATNAFYASHSQSITPILAAAVLKWQAADAVERAGKADARSFIWRAGFYDLILIVACLCHGEEATQSMGATIMGMYGETLPEYLEEFANA